MPHKEYQIVRESDGEIVVLRTATRKDIIQRIFNRMMRDIDKEPHRVVVRHNMGRATVTTCIITPFNDEYFIRYIYD